MRSYKVGLKDLKFLVEGFVDGMYFTRTGAVRWCKENKEIITPEFMKRVRASPDGFFYYESHLREDLDEFEKMLNELSETEEILSTL